MVAALAPTQSQAVEPAPQRSPYIVSRGFDSVFFLGSVGAVIAAWIASSVFQVDGFYILAAVAVVSNGPHLAATWTRVYFDARERRTRPLQIFLAPALIAVAVVGLTLKGYDGQRVLTTVLLYWATWHFLAQNWGLLRIYQKRSGEPDTSLALRLERPLMYLGVGWCMLHRLETGPRNLFGIDVAYVSLPWPVIHALLAVACAVAALYVALRIRDRHQPWGPTSWVRMAFVGCALIGFFVPFILITADGTPAFAAAACWHGFQYLGIVRFYHRNAWKDGLNPDARVMSWLSKPSNFRRFLYAGLLLALAGVGYVFIYSGSLLTQGTAWTIETWGGVVWMSFTFSHYYLDGVIWKLRKDREMAARLLIQPT